MSDDWAALVDDQESNAKDLSKQVDALSLKKDAAASNNQPAAAASNNQPAAAAAASGGGEPAGATASNSGWKETANSSWGEPAGATPANSGWDEQTEQDDRATLAESSLINKKLREQLGGGVKDCIDLEVLQKDPNSPLYSIKTFEALNLRPELLKGVHDMGFISPSKIQETALPMLLATPGNNMIAQSQSGTGKTAAFVLTMLSRVDVSKHYPQCLCLSPTYELACQTGEVVQKMGKHMQGLNIKMAVRGNRVARGQRIEDHILIGTPGTMMDWALKFRFFDMKKVDVFVLDEADVMIDTQGHQDQSIRLQRELRRDCQMLLFSATYDTRVMKFAEAMIKDPCTIKLRREEESLVNIKQMYIRCYSREDKFTALSNIYGTISIGQCMIFCHTRRTANWLTEQMTKDGHTVALLSGELDVEQRSEVIRRFREAKQRVLITTNVSSRGIDVEQVTVVVNFDLPIDQQRQPDFETYLHRIGRTGRFGKKGLAINMVDSDQAMDILTRISEHFGKPIKKLDAEDIDELEKLENN